ncbi:Gfo/Idh/MocA family protein [Planctomycetes bacterium K23_9]|uniref:Inositol 2-dehydrogenase n=1 Tax=Stieleria marina TaxID=1930275 RepID=A0A517NU86_9BACT|nr:Inositol 2-dehydrogenase [Planctomycetes bacterium K23_9]
MKSTRRGFIATTATVGSALAISNGASAADDSKKLRLGVIGVGGSRGRYNRGGAIARQAAKFATTVAVCDVDDRHTAEYAKEFDEKHGLKLNKYRDYREMLEKEELDCVTIGTPDHWHVPIAIAALEAGLHVYCEKPLTLTIDEGKQIRDAVEKSGKVFQVGTQQRSSKDLFLTAIAMVQTGRLGDNVNAYVAIGGAPGDGPFKDTEAPEDLDWDMWVGPAPKAKYSEERRRFFRWYFEYSGGKMTDWGAHHIDIAQWALSPGETGPVKVTSKGKFPNGVPSGFNWSKFLDGEISLPNTYNTATEFHIDLTFASGAVLNVNHHYKREGDNVDFGNGILFEGDKGRIFVNRGKLEGKPMNDLTDADKKELEEKVIELCKGKKPGNHMGNFFECIADGGKPISDVWSHHRTMTSCHLCNISLMLGRELKWNPKTEEFDGDDQANKLLSRKSREGFGAKVATVS